jgi:K+-transporting ATPase ATPase B chain
MQKNIKKQIDRVKEQNMMTILVTGDNDLTACYVSKRLGIDAYVADASPEDKLELVQDMQSRGHSVAMYGDGLNDTPALAQADIAISFSHSNHHALQACNIISMDHALDTLVDLKRICRKMSIKRGALIIFSLASDIAKYFAIVPSLFNTQLPELKVFNVMNLYSVDSAMLASVIWSAVAIIGVTPFVFIDSEDKDDGGLLWRNMSIYGLCGIFAPFLFIKLIDMAIVYLGIV